MNDQAFEIAVYLYGELVESLADKQNYSKTKDLPASTEIRLDFEISFLKSNIEEIIQEIFRGRLITQ